MSVANLQVHEGADVRLAADSAAEQAMFRRPSEWRIFWEAFSAVALGLEGARVTTAPSVAGAVEAIERGWPDVLISDIGMPGEDGYDLIRTVRRLEASRGRHIPAIALTAYAAAEDRRRALEAGYEAHVAKPVPPTTVTPLIVSLLPLRR